MSIPFGKYALQRQLAEGGMAEVFLARQSGLEGFEKLVVVKRIKPELTRDPQFVNMFLNEARLAARLNHPNIVQIFELGKVDANYFIAMEFVHGEDLRQVAAQANLAGEHLPHGLVCRIIADTLAGLHYAHTRSSPDGKPLGLVHRDVSPQNVLVTYEGGVKLVDFGIAKVTKGQLSEQTQAGQFKGKFAYMSPEQSRGQSLDARADIFALGILLWELLTWTRLFKRPTEMATLIAVAEADVPSPRSFDTSIPAELERVVMRALARPLEQRYATALEMRAEMETLIRAQGWEADSLALERYMRRIFEKKLKAQEADISSSGSGSIEDFLLRVDESSKIAWMEPLGSGVRTPSAGFAASSLGEAKLPGLTVPQPAKLAFANTEELAAAEPAHAHDELPELPGSSTAITPMSFAEPSAPAPSEEVVDSDKGLDLPLMRTEIKLPPPKPELAPAPSPFKVPERAVTLRTLAQPEPAPQPAPSPHSTRSVPVTDLPSLPTAIVVPPEPLPDLPSQPTQIAAPAPAPIPELPPQSTMNLPQPLPPESTDRKPAPRSSWPRRAAMGGAAAGIVATLLLAVAYWPSAPSTPQAVLEISVDSPAMISVDGKEVAVGMKATVNVRAGVEHTVTVQRAGDSPRTLKVPRLSADEHLPLNVNLH